MPGKFWQGSFKGFFMIIINVPILLKTEMKERAIQLPSKCPLNNLQRLCGTNTESIILKCLKTLLKNKAYI